DGSGVGANSFRRRSRWLSLYLRQRPSHSSGERLTRVDPSIRALERSSHQSIAPSGDSLKTVVSLSRLSMLNESPRPASAAHSPSGEISRRGFHPAPGGISGEMANAVLRSHS